MQKKFCQNFAKFTGKQGTSINILSKTHQRKAQVKMFEFFLLDAPRTVFQMRQAQMSTIRVFFPKIRHFFNLQKKGKRGFTSHMCLPALRTVHRRTYIRRKVFSIPANIWALNQCWNNLDRQRWSTLFQLWYLVENENWVDVHLSTLF